MLFSGGHMSKTTRCVLAVLAVVWTAACGALFAQDKELQSEPFLADLGQTAETRSSVVVTIPLLKASTLAVRRVDLPGELARPGSLAAAGAKAYRVIANLQAFEKSGGAEKPVGQFSPPLKITLEYAKTDIIRAGGKEAGVKLFFYVRPVAEKDAPKRWIAFDDPELGPKYGVVLIGELFASSLMKNDTRARRAVIHVKAWPVDDVVIGWDG
jgi:hypothetical protein